MMHDHRAVGRSVDIQLDAVGAKGEGAGEGREGVLGSLMGGPAVRDGPGSVHGINIAPEPFVSLASRCPQLVRRTTARQTLR